MQEEHVALRRHDDLEDVWRALSNPTRRAILDLLRSGPMTTGALADEFPDLSRFAIMQHLGVLEEAELVVPRREGRRRYNYLNPVPIQQIHDRWVSRYTRPWTEALVDLRDELESDPSSRSA
jgi:DNA-binding transcriptional ArsR family regulator